MGTETFNKMNNMDRFELAHLRLPGITRLQLQKSRGPKDVFIFDPHRLAMSCWALMEESTRGALLVTLDRHFDLVPPQKNLVPPLYSQDLKMIDDFVRWELDVRNYDHILAAMHAGLIQDALVVARARPKGCFSGENFVDASGRSHRILGVPTIDRVAQDFGTPHASEEARQAIAMIEAAPAIFLDVDLDCFTTPSDADPTTFIPWPQELISQFVLPEGSLNFWNAVLAKTVCVTIAREPAHCGGVLATGRLFESAAHILFQKLLDADLP